MENLIDRRCRAAEKKTEWDALQEQAFLFAKELGLPCKKLTKTYREKISRIAHGALDNRTQLEQEVPQDIKDLIKNRQRIQ
jgi:hypothetical protein